MLMLGTQIVPRLRGAFWQNWESNLRSQKRGRQGAEESSSDSSALTALKQWSNVPKKAREAMKRCTPEVVETIELPILEFLDRVSPLHLM